MASDEMMDRIDAYLVDRLAYLVHVMQETPREELGCKHFRSAAYEVVKVSLSLLHHRKENVVRQDGICEGCYAPVSAHVWPVKVEGDEAARA